MKHCDACNVDFTGDMVRCPLCQNELHGEASPAAFPAQQIYLRPRRLTVEIITFVTGAILLLHGFFSYLFSWPIPIASASAAALIISVLFINSAILHAPRPLRLMFRYFYIMLAIALVWFVATMNHVVTMFVIPITCLVSLVFDVVLLIVLRAKAIDQYAKYLAFDIVAGLLPLTFIPLGWAPWDVLVIVSGLVSPACSSSPAVSSSRNSANSSRPDCLVRSIARLRMETMSEHVEHGFGPVWDGESQVLILGSMPSPKSRASAFYYMHPQNRFWPVMQALFANSADPTDAVGDLPEFRRAFALRYHIALWDVIASCDITGASDASIRNAEPNDLAPILRGAPIAHIFTTGAKSAQLYRKLIEPRLTEAGIAIGMTQLPSTSPANASMRLPDLITAYREAFQKANVLENAYWKN